MDATEFTLRSLENVAMKHIGEKGAEACIEAHMKVMDGVERHGIMANVRYFQALLRIRAFLEQNREINTRLGGSPECVKVLDDMIDDYTGELLSTIAEIEKVRKGFMMDHEEDIMGGMEDEVVDLIMPVIEVNYILNKLQQLGLSTE